VSSRRFSFILRAVGLHARWWPIYC